MDLVGKIFTFGHADGRIFGQIQLLDDGKVGLYSHHNERGWRLVDGDIHFFDGDGKLATRFIKEGDRWLGFRDGREKGFNWLKEVKSKTLEDYSLEVSSNDLIEINITDRCNLSCINCHQLCGFNKNLIHSDLSVSDIDSFIKDCIFNGKKWRRIGIIGGEPTLNKDIVSMMSLLVSNAAALGDPQIIIYTNGSTWKNKNHEKIVKELIGLGFCYGSKSFSSGKLVLCDSNKDNGKVYHNVMYFISPKDVRKNSNLENMDCQEIKQCGLSLGPDGVFICHHAYAFSKIKKQKSKIKSISEINDSLIMEQLKDNCTHCGYNIKNTVTVSEKYFSKYWEDYLTKL